MVTVKKILVLLFIIAGIAGEAQSDVNSDLHKILMKKDSILFDAAFNECDTETLSNLFTKDFEFYHDKSGATEGRTNFVNQIANGCSNRDPELPQPAKRILVEGSVKVYPLYNNGQIYGAIQHGVHTFEFLNAEHEYQKGDIAKFTHLWVLEDGHWKIKRELSYDHQLQQ